MTRILAQYVPATRQGLLELALSFLLIHCLLVARRVLEVLQAAPPKLSPNCADVAAILALILTGTAATIGLYRPEVCRDRKRLPANATVSALIAVPSVVLIRVVFSSLVVRSRFERRIPITDVNRGTELICRMSHVMQGGLFQPIQVGGDLSALAP